MQPLWGKPFADWKEVEKKFIDRESLTDGLKREIADFKSSSEKTKVE